MNGRLIQYFCLDHITDGLHDESGSQGRLLLHARVAQAKPFHAAHEIFFIQESERRDFMRTTFFPGTYRVELVRHNLCPATDRWMKYSLVPGGEHRQWYHVV